MSKKKNTLKDLDEFLKQQAATLVAPEKLVKETITKDQRAEKEPLDLDSIVHDLKTMSVNKNDAFRQQFYDLIIDVFGSRPDTSPEDKMLINTALYLKSGDAWKEAIRAYWNKK